MRAETKRAGTPRILERLVRALTSSKVKWSHGGVLSREGTRSDVF